MEKRLLCILLVLMLCIGLLPVGVLATGDEPELPSVEEESSTEEAYTEEAYTEEAYTEEVEESILSLDGEAAVEPMPEPVVDSGSCGENVTWTLTTDGVLTISGTGAIKDYWWGTEANGGTEDRPWSGYYGSIESLVIGDGITAIGAYAFSDVFGIQSLNIPDGVVSIGRYAFNGCTSLASVGIPASVATIGEGGFAACSNLQKISYAGTRTQWAAVSVGYVNRMLSVNPIECSDGNVPVAAQKCGENLSWSLKDNVFTISGSGDMYTYESMEACPWHELRNEIYTAVISNGVTSISSHTFSNCHYLTDVTIAGSVKSMGESAFNACYKLEQIVIPEGMESLGSLAFSSCEKLACVTLPVSLKSIAFYAFNACAALKTVNYSGTKAQMAQVTVDEPNDDLFAASIVCTDGAYEVPTVTPTPAPTATPEPEPTPTPAPAVYSGSCGENVTWTLTKGVLTISGSGAMAEYMNSSDAPWYDHRGEVRSLVVEDGITSICKFADHYILESAVIGKDVEKIRTNAFWGCSKLKSVQLGSGLVSIESYAFEGCAALTELTIPAGVTSIGENAFAQCESVTSYTVEAGNTAYKTDASGALYTADMKTLIRYPSESKAESYTVPSGVKTISSWAFCGAENLKNLTIAGSVTEIGVAAFMRCTALESVVLPKVRELSSQLFTECASLKTVALPDTINYISTWVFSGCKALQTVNYAGSQAQWQGITISDINNDALGTATINYGVDLTPEPDASGSCGEGLTWSYAKGVLTITGSGAMTDFEIYQAPWYPLRTKITSVSVGENVTTVGTFAFYDCAALMSVSLPTSLIELKNNAFTGCTGLKNVSYSGTQKDWIKVTGTENVPADVMNYRDTQPVGPDGPDGPGDEPEPTSGSCGDALTWELTEDGALIITGTGAMYDYDHASDTIASDGAGMAFVSAPWNRSADKIKSISLPEGLTHIGRAAFYSGVETITIPASVTSIGNGAFTMCSQLKTIVLAEGNTAFKLVDGALLTADGSEIVCLPAAKEGTYTIPETVRVIREHAFACTAITGVTIPNGVETIGHQAFAESRIQEIVVPNSVMQIGRGAFSHNMALGKATLPSGLTEISESLFMYCRGLSDVTIPDGVTSIGGWAFGVLGEGSITEIAIPASVTEIGNNAFSNQSKLTKVNYGGTQNQWNAIEIGMGNDYLKNAALTCAKTATVSGTGTDGLAWDIADGVLTITGSGAMAASYTEENPAPWKNHAADIRTIVIGSGVTLIAPNAFAGCTAATSVTLPKSVTKLDANAFGECSALTQVFYASTPRDWAKVTQADKALPTAATVVCALEDIQWSITALQPAQSDGDALRYTFCFMPVKPNDAYYSVELQIGSKSGQYSDYSASECCFTKVLTPGATIYYRFGLRDTEYQQSYYSEEASFTVPTPEGIEDLTLDQAETIAADTSALYRFAPGKAGAYLIKTSGVTPTVYQAHGEEPIMYATALDESGVTCVSLSAKAVLYLSVPASEQEGAITVSAAPAVEAGKDVEAKAGAWYSFAGASGHYVLQAETGFSLNAAGKFCYAGSVVYLSKSNRLQCVTDGTFRLVEVSKAGLPALDPAGITLTLNPNECRSYSFTVPNGGYYLVENTTFNTRMYSRMFPSGEQAEGGVLYELAKGDVVYFTMSNITDISGDVKNGTFRLVNLKTDTKPIELGQTLSAEEGEYFLLHVSEPGWYVAQCGSMNRVRSSWEDAMIATDSGVIFSHSLYTMVNSTTWNYSADFLLAAGSDGKVSARKATADDFTPMELNKDYAANGIYRLAATESADYKILSESGDVCVYNGKGEQLATVRNGAAYAHVDAGDALCVSLMDGSFRVETTTIPTLNPGEQMSVTVSDCVRYQFTVPETGQYAYRYQSENEAVELSIYTSDGRSNRYRDAVGMLSLEKGETVYFDLRLNAPSERTATLAVGTWAQMFPTLMELDTTYTTARKQDGFRYVPENTGLYILTSGENRVDVYGGAATAIYDKQTTGFVHMEAGEEYLLLAEKSGTEMKLQTPEQYALPQIALDRTESVTKEQYYSFSVSESGFYVFHLSDAYATLYNDKHPNYFVGIYGYGGDADEVVLSLKAGETYYLSLSPRGSKGSFTLRRADLSSYPKLEAGQKITFAEEWEGSEYVIEGAGKYVLSTTSNVLLTVITENGGVDGYEYIIPTNELLFELKEGESAYVQTQSLYDEANPVDETALELFKLEDAPTTMLESGAAAAKVAARTIGVFTAQWDGDYTVTIHEGFAMVYGPALSGTFIDTYGDVDSVDNTTVTLKKGESLYVSAAHNRNEEATFTIARVGGEMSVVGALDDIPAETEAEEIRSAVQEIGKDNLTEALTGEDGAEVVKKLDALEKSTGSGSVSIVVEESAQDVVAKDNVTIIGATLNELAEDGADVTLTIRSADEQTVNALDIPNTVSKDDSKVVHLELELDGVANAKELAVPVCITMAVPEGIHWELVRLVHYGESGAETLTPVLYKEGGVTYARFVIGGFSPFTLTELNHVPGDVDGNGSKNIMDVLALLKSVAGISSKIVYGDVNNSGAADIMDVLALLKSVAGIQSTIY